jgi:hypothetical protein
LTATRRVLIAITLAWSLSSVAGPGIAPGDVVLRHDILRLADAGIIKGTVSTWPLAWGPIADDIRDAGDAADLPADVWQSLMRVRRRAEREMRVGELQISAQASLAEMPMRIRSFQGTPRESAEIGAGISWTGNRWTVNLNGQYVDSPADGEDFRADGSEIAVILGNYSISANTLDRWSKLHGRFLEQMVELARPVGSCGAFRPFRIGPARARCAILWHAFQLQAVALARNRLVQGSTMVRRRPALWFRHFRRPVPRQG